MVQALESIACTGQYFVYESSMERSTATASTLCPSTIYSMVMWVNTLGNSEARSACTRTIKRSYILALLLQDGDDIHTGTAG